MKAALDTISRQDHKTVPIGKGCKQKVRVELSGKLVQEILETPKRSTHLVKKSKLAFHN